MSGDQPTPPNDSDLDYKVGNKSPPKHTRFKPGVSGNPKGRPKGSVNLRTRVVRSLRQSVTVNRNGRSVRMMKSDLIALQITDAAAKGDFKAAVLALRLDDEAASASILKSSEELFELPNGENLRFIFNRLQRIVEENA